MDLIKGILYGLLAQVLSFIQLQGRLQYSWLKDNMWLAVLMGLPISYLLIKSVEHLVGAYNGQLWPSRLIGIGVGVLVFTIMSYLLFKEALTIKTIVCLCLAVLIILIQVLWRS